MKKQIVICSLLMLLLSGCASLFKTPEYPVVAQNQSVTLKDVKMTIDELKDYNGQVEVAIGAYQNAGYGKYFIDGVLTIENQSQNEIKINSDKIQVRSNTKTYKAWGTTGLIGSAASALLPNNVKLKPGEKDHTRLLFTIKKKDTLIELIIPDYGTIPLNNYIHKK